MICVYVLLRSINVVIQIKCLSLYIYILLLHISNILDRYIKYVILMYIIYTDIY